MPKIDIFATPPLEVVPLFHNTSEEQFSKISEYVTDTSKSNSISTNIDVLSDPIFSNLKSKMYEAASNYVKNTLMIDDEIKYTNSWIALSKKGQNHHNHNHPGALVSVVFYVYCISGNLILTKERSGLQEGFNFSYNVKKYNEYNSRMWTISTKTGDLAIFPGWIAHESSENLLDDDRVVIGANYFLTGNIGESLDEVKL